MVAADKHPKERERQAALERLRLLDTLPEEEFDRLTLIASQVFGVPMSAISLIDESRQWFKSRRGLAVSETPREQAFCAHAILEPGVFVVNDATKDDRFKDNPFVTGDAHVRFYAGAPVSSPDGYPIGTLCVIDDKPRTIEPDQILALEALAQIADGILKLRNELTSAINMNAEAKYKAVAIQNLSEGVVLIDSTTRTLEFNAAALRILRVTADELTGRTALYADWKPCYENGEPFPKEKHPSIVALTTGEPQKNVVMGVRRGGEELRWLQISSTPLFLTDSLRPSHTVTSFSDITELKINDQLIRKKESELNRVLNGLPALIARWDQNLTLLNSNESFAKYFGTSSDLLRGKKMDLLLGAERFEENRAYVEAVLSGKAQTFERPIQAANGEKGVGLVTYIPDAENGQTVGFFSVVTDVSQMKSFERERSHLAASLVESARMSTLGEMAGGIAHEINTPLAGIITRLSLVQQKLKSEVLNAAEISTHVERAIATAERIAKIIKGLRQFSRSSGEDPIETISVLSVVESTLELCRERIVGENIELKIDVAPDLEIPCRATQISQVLMNLISNSLDATAGQSNRWIELSAAEVDGYVFMNVTDSGGGIAPAIAEKMMNPFFTTKEIGDGTGLGLSISKGIIEAHGGKIVYQSHAPNTRFTIELPAAQKSD